MPGTLVEDGWGTIGEEYVHAWMCVDCGLRYLGRKVWVLNEAVFVRSGVEMVQTNGQPMYRGVAIEKCICAETFKETVARIRQQNHDHPR